MQSLPEIIYLKNTPALPPRDCKVGPLTYFAQLPFTSVSVYYVAVRTIVLSRHGSNLARPVIIHDIFHDIATWCTHDLHNLQNNLKRWGISEILSKFSINLFPLRLTWCCFPLRAQPPALATMPTLSDKLNSCKPLWQFFLLEVLVKGQRLKKILVNTIFSFSQIIKMAAN